jgi:hypothetical protein
MGIFYYGVVVGGLIEQKEILEKCYNRVLNDCGGHDLLDFWIRNRDNYFSILGESLYQELNLKIIREHGQSINS